MRLLIKAKIELIVKRKEIVDITDKMILFINILYW